MQAAVPACVSEDLQRPSFKRVMRANNSDPIREVPEVGSVWWFPLTTWITNGW